MNRKLKLGLFLFILLVQTGCPAVDLWRPHPSTPEEYEKGLIVLYPGSSNMHIEVSGFYTAIEKKHLGLAMEIVPWGTFMEHDFDPIGTQPLFKQRAEVE